MDVQPISMRGAGKTAHLGPAVTGDVKPLPKPSWLRAPAAGTPDTERLVRLLRDNSLHTVCEEASCPNMGECFRKGTATFMIMGDICTRNCPFCNVAHGSPQALPADEPANLARAVEIMKLNYVVITSVTRDDLPDGGAGHYADCIRALRELKRELRVEILTPDFRGAVDRALELLGANPPDVFNHNLETVPRLYPRVRSQADYRGSLELLLRFREKFYTVPTKSGLMLGLGETEDEVREVMEELRNHRCDMLTLGQYLRPSPHHLPVERYVRPEEFERLRDFGLSIGFSHVESGPMVRSSYHADMQARELV